MAPGAGPKPGGKTPAPANAGEEAEGPPGPPGDGNVPKGAGFAPGAGETRAGVPQPVVTGPAVPVRTDATPWGDLPIRVRERFRNQGDEEFPSHYRRWIEAYYRKLNQRRR